MPSERQPTPQQRFAEIASLLARGILRLKTYPSNAPEKPPGSGRISLDVRRDISPYVADG